MKKTLIALASIAAVGAASAQVSITGYMSAGYVVATAPGTAATNLTNGGFAVDTSELYIKSSEDMGGGYKASAGMGLGGLERATDANNGYGKYGLYGNNFDIKIAGPMGSIAVGNTKSGDYASGGLGGVGVLYYDFADHGNFSARSRRDYLTVTAPVGPVSVTVSHQEAGNVTGWGGAEGSTSQRISIGAVTYAAGPLSVNAMYFTYDNEVAKSDATGSNVLRFAGSYDLGMAKLGSGYQKLTVTSGGTSTQFTIAASVPLGAITLGAIYGSREISGMTGAALLQNGSYTNTGLTANYQFSKRTGLIGQMSSYDGIKSAGNLTPAKGGLTLLLLTHSF